MKRQISEYWKRDLSQYFSIEYMKLAKNHMKKCLASLVFREMQIKGTVRYYLTSPRLVIIKRQIISIRKRLDTSNIVGRNVKLFRYIGK
jgi:hypothetical protein